MFNPILQMTPKAPPSVFSDTYVSEYMIPLPTEPESFCLLNFRKKSKMYFTAHVPRDGQVGVNSESPGRFC